MTRVLIIDDHPLFLQGLRILIDDEPGLKVTCEAHSRAEALEALTANHPDLAIVDLNLGQDDGLELIKELRARSESLVILVISMLEEAHYATRAIHAGARGYVMKEEVAETVITAIKTVLDGKIWLSKSEKERFFDPLDSSDITKRLTDKQLKVFSLLGKGLNVTAIGEKLSLSTKTVETHQYNIRKTLGCETAGEVRQLAIKWMAKQNPTG